MATNIERARGNFDPYSWNFTCYGVMGFNEKMLHHYVRISKLEIKLSKRIMKIYILLFLEILT